FVIGAVTGNLANRRMDIGAGPTSRLVVAATLLGGVGLVLAALEGVVCIIMAAPLGIGAAWVGGILGRAIAIAGRSPGPNLPALALIPLVFGTEAALPIATRIDTVQAVTVEAPPEEVWRSLIRMDTIDEPLALPFRLGLAFPVRGEVIGEGVGALRLGEF